MSPVSDAFNRVKAGEKVELIETKTESGEDDVYHVVNILQFKLVYRAAAKINLAIRCQFDRRFDWKYAYVSIQIDSQSDDYPEPSAQGDK